MEINIKVEELRKRKLFVATPMYGGNCSGMFTKSTNDLSAMCMHYGIELRFYYLFNESLITRARNYCVDEFLRSESTHMMFIDADIGFNHQDVLSMLALMDEESDYDILCGPYPKKCISWEKIRDAVNQGRADDNPNDLEQYVGDYVFNPVGNTGQIKLDVPSQVLEGGTGFMMIKREALEKYCAHYTELLYKPDHVRTESFDGSREITAVFDTVIDPESKRYLSEDYMFCQYARKIGLTVWMCPWMELRHVGTYIFGGSLQALASIDASATADIKKISKNNPLGGPPAQKKPKKKKASGKRKN